MKTGKSWLGVSTAPLVSVYDLSLLYAYIPFKCTTSLLSRLSGTLLSSLSITYHTKRYIMGNCAFLILFQEVELIQCISSKAPTQTQKFKTLQKLILSFFSNITHLISQLTDEDTLRLAITESAKLVPYIINSRKAVKLYLKVCAFPFFQKSCGA